MTTDPERAATDTERIEELREIIQAVRERVRARYAGTAASGENGERPAVRIAPTDLMPLVHARDAAQAKVAAIGSVNPRAGGPINHAIQAVKRLIARSLAWFVRDQIVFNRETIAAVEAVLEAMNEQNNALLDLAGQTSEQLRHLREEIDRVVALGQEFSDIRTHWTDWRAGQEQRIATSEIQFLRSVADLQGAFQHRVTQMESNFRDLVKSQHADYLGALDRANLDVQKRLWADMEKLRWQHERMIHAELRLIRQRLGRDLPQAGATSEASEEKMAPVLDYTRFAERFRGPEENVRKSQEFYGKYFEGRERVLDIGCGRGEFLDLMREMGISAKGIDLSAESVAQCREKGFDAEVANLFAFLENAGEGEFDGIFCSQVVEHLDPMLLPRMISLCARKLARGGVIAIETPNPECLAIFATFFYLDPTHTRPVPRDLLEFYMTEAGMSEIGVHPLSPAAEMFPEIGELPEGFRNRFFGALDYALIARKL